MKALMIAAPSSGAGKTTVSRALMALLTRRGYRVQPFKCGPDYIDTKFHEHVCRRASVNLDTFMATEQHVRELFYRYSADADIAIVEGMMGLYDGYDRDRGSSADIARALGLPVVLVVDARSAAYSLAPLLRGFADFRPEVHLTGVLFNKVGSERHATMLRQVCQDVGLPCLGCLPKQTDAATDSRYLGLDFSELTTDSHADNLTALLERHADIDSLLAMATFDTGDTAPILSPELRTNSLKPRTLVARNEESFTFLYREVLDQLGQVTFFDPETDVPDLSDTDLLYLPGGYPEKHAEALARNEAARQAIADYAGRGGRIQAECGGMMYLCRDITTDEGRYPMCGVLPYSITARREDRRLSLGYRRFVLDGLEWRGHEFHYSQFLGDVPPSVCQVYDALGHPVATPVMRHKNVLASYTHLNAIIT
jgi:cobyrinic acid a,c-diamide synthase